MAKRKNRNTNKKERKNHIIEREEKKRDRETFSRKKSAEKSILPRWRIHHSYLATSHAPEEIEEIEETEVENAEILFVERDQGVDSESFHSTFPQPFSILLLRGGEMNEGFARLKDPNLGSVISQKIKKKEKKEGETWNQNKRTRMLKRIQRDKE